MRSSLVMFGKCSRALCLDEIKPLFDPQDAFIDAVEPCRNGRILMFEDAKTLLDDLHVVGEPFDGAPDGTQVLKYEVVG